MADPVIPDVYRAQVRVPGKSALPHDVFVNTFAFRNDQLVSAEMADLLVTVLTAFYGFFDQYLSNTQALWSGTELRVYDLGQQPPRQPQIREMPITASGSGNPYPGEVACCLSYYAERNLPRNRGRLYIGPLLASSATVSTTEVVPTQAFVDALIDGGANLIGTTEDVTWGLVSQMDQDFKVVTNLWVDNAYDTQRRRGREPTARTVWPAIE